MINLTKSNLFGVGIQFADVQNLATVTGCQALNFPFTYLGLSINCNMSRCKGSTLITSVLGNLDNIYFSMFPMPSQINKRLKAIRSKFFWGSYSWITWNTVLASKPKGGLGIGSLLALNLALIQKLRSINGGATKAQLDDLSSLFGNSFLIDKDDSWIWCLGNSIVFNVKDTKNLRDDSMLPDSLTPTRWCRFISKKVNI
nr:reverse transcriptase domain, reverse transcriptase zinc-binding domain protein [Tanacetum cinerariifolium]